MLADVVVVVVGQQDVRRVDRLRTAASKSGCHRAARVDEEPRAARPSRREVGVRQESARHGSFDEHAQRTGASSPCADPRVRSACRADPHLLPHRRHRPLGRVLRGARLRGASAACRSATRRSTSSWACPATATGLELTYNHGVDEYELGTGYNHIAITVPTWTGRSRARRAGHRAREAAVLGARGRLAALLRPRPRRLPDRAHRAQLSGVRPARLTRVCRAGLRLTRGRLRYLRIQQS